MDMHCYVGLGFNLFYDATPQAFALKLLPQGIIGDEL